MISVQSYMTGGASSVLYFGTHIAVGIVIAFFQFPPIATIALVASVYSTYIPLLLLTPSTNDLSLVILQVIFCISFSVIAFVSNMYSWRLRQQEFSARLMLENDHLQNEIQIRRLNTLLDISRQAAHDIRSPLTALDAIAKNLTSLSEEQRKLFLAVASRFNGISDHLLRSSKNLTQNSTESQTLSMSSGNVLDLCKNLLTEKKILKPNLTFIADFPDSLGEPASYRAHPIELGAILSNLINNSIEASSDGQTISFTAKLEPATLFITLSDHGDGIPAEVQSQLLHRPVTFGKENGNGLGLYSASRIIQRWGGNFKIISDGRSGTTIEIKIITTDGLRMERA